MEAADNRRGRRGRVNEGRRRNGQLYPNGQWMLVTASPPHHVITEEPKLFAGGWPSSHLVWGQGLSGVGGPGVNPPSTPYQLCDTLQDPLGAPISPLHLWNRRVVAFLQTPPPPKFTIRIHWSMAVKTGCGVWGSDTNANGEASADYHLADAKPCAVDTIVLYSPWLFGLRWQTGKRWGTFASPFSFETKFKRFFRKLAKPGCLRFCISPVHMGHFPSAPLGLPWPFSDLCLHASLLSKQTNR